MDAGSEPLEGILWESEFWVVVVPMPERFLSADERTAVAAALGA
ncbi:MAG: hypothetical protein WD981_08200 [Gaiellaceae bacterium]